MNPYISEFSIFCINLFLLSDSAKHCAARTNKKNCYLISDREECLTSNDARVGQFLNQPCVWCPNGPCSTAYSNRCEPKSWLANIGVRNFEDCSGTYWYLIRIRKKGIYNENVQNLLFLIIWNRNFDNSIFRLCFQETLFLIMR